MSDEKYFYCYECGARSPHKESVMQKYDCSVCGGRKCNIHTDINKNLKCEDCGTDNLCSDCLGFMRCCKDL